MRIGITFFQKITHYAWAWNSPIDGSFLGIAALFIHPIACYAQKVQLAKSDTSVNMSQAVGHGALFFLWWHMKRTVQKLPLPVRCNFPSQKLLVFFMFCNNISCSIWLLSTANPETQRLWSLFVMPIYRRIVKFPMGDAKLLFFPVFLWSLF